MYSYYTSNVAICTVVSIYTYMYLKLKKLWSPYEHTAHYIHYTVCTYSSLYTLYCVYIQLIIYTILCVHTAHYIHYNVPPHYITLCILFHYIHEYTIIIYTVSLHTAQYSGMHVSTHLNEACSGGLDQVSGYDPN